jgi:hypothetical protein
VGASTIPGEGQVENARQPTEARSKASTSGEVEASASVKPAALQSEDDKIVVACDELATKTRASIAAIPRSCEVNADCTSIRFKCPFGCSTIVSRAGAESARSAQASTLAAEFRQQCKRCAYRCGPTVAACVDGTCMRAEKASKPKPESSSSSEARSWNVGPEHISCTSHRECRVAYRGPHCSKTDPIAVNQSGAKFVYRKMGSPKPCPPPPAYAGRDPRNGGYSYGARCDRGACRLIHRSPPASF